MSERERVSATGAGRSTLLDVARATGVSVATASRALSGAKGVSAQTERLVREAARTLGYQPRSAADERSNRTLGVIVARVASSFFGTLIEAIEEVATLHGYDIILTSSNYRLDKQEECLRVMAEKHVAGVIVTPIQLDDPYMKKLIDGGMRVVQVARYMENVACDAVLTDNVRCSCRAVDFLLQQGYRRIGVISGLQNHSIERDRLEGYRQAYAQYGVPVNERLIRVGAPERAWAYQLASELIESRDRPDALFTTSLSFAYGALQSIRDHGLRIPDDIGAITFDEFEYAGLLDPPMTTVEQPVHEMGRAAAKLLIRRIESADREIDPVTVILESRLIVRSSTRPQSAERLPVGEGASGISGER